MQYTGTTATTDRSFTVSAGGTGTFNVATTATNLTLTGSAAATTGTLAKTGPGTLTLAANNAQTGGLLVNGGLLVVTNSQSYGGTTNIQSGTLRLGTTPGVLPVTSGLLYDLNASVNGGLTTSNGTVSSFNDLSGNNNNFTSTTSTGVTVLSGSNGINGQTVVHFGGSNTTTNQLVLSKATTAASVFIIDRVTTAHNNIDGIWGQIGDFGIREAGTTAWYYNSGSNNGDYANPSYGGNMLINGVQVPAGTNGAFTLNTAQLLEATNTNSTYNAWTSTGLGEYGTGGAANRYFTGDIGEVVAYSGTLTTAQRQAVEAYLNAEWMTTPAVGNNLLPATTTINLSSSAATFDLGYNNNQTLNSLTGVAASSVDLGIGTLTTGGDNTNTTFAGNMVGQGNLAKIGTGTFVLSGVNTYAGTTSITSGVLQLGDGVNTTGVAQGNIVNNAALTFANPNAVTYGGLISGSGGVTAAGPGLLTFGSAAHTYSGSTTLSGGTLSVGTLGIVGSGGAPSALGSSSNAAGNLVFQGGTLQYTGATATTDRNFTISGGSTGTISVASAATNLTLTGAAAVSSTGTLVKAGPGILTLAANNAQTGGLTVSGGSVLVNTAQTYTGATIIAAGATLRVPVAPGSPVAGTLLYDLDASNSANFVLSGSSVTTWKDSSQNQYSFNSTGSSPIYITSGTDTINGKPVVYFNGANSNQLRLSTALTPTTLLYVTRTTGYTSLNTLVAPNDTGDGGLRMASSTSWMTTGDTNDFTTGPGGAVYINGAATNSFTAGQPYVLTAYRGASYTHNNTGTNIGGVFGGRFYYGDVGEIIAYSGSLSTADMQADQAYLNAKWMSTSSIMGGTNFLPANTPVTLSGSGATLDLGYESQTLGSITGAAGSSILMAPASSTGTLTVGTDNTSTLFAGSISGYGTLLKTGTGTLTLSGVNTYSATTAIANGVLVVSGAETGSSLTTLTGGALNITGTMGSGGYSTTGGTINFSGQQTIAAAGSQIVLGNGLGNGTLNITGGSLTNNGAAGTILGQLGGNGVMNVSGGVYTENVTTGNWIIGNAGGSADSGTLNISGAGLVIANGPSAFIYLGRSNVNMTGTINLNGGTLSTGRSITRDTSQALGTAIVNFNGGTLQAAGTNNAAWISNITSANVLDGGATFDTNGLNMGIPQPLLAGGSGIGTVTKIGSGTLTLAGDNTYPGATNVNAGALAVTGTLASGVTNVNAGNLIVNGVLNSTGTVNLVGGILSGTGSLGNAYVSGGLIDVSANGTTPLTFAGLNFSGGTLHFASSISSPPINVSGGVTTSGGSVTNINIDGLTAVTGTYDLMSYSGSIGGSGGLSGFVLGNHPLTSTRQTATLIDTGSMLEWNVVGGNPIWTGLNGSAWSGGSNWKLSTDNSTTDYQEGDIVTVNDIASGSTTLNISGTGNVNPTTVTFNNSTMPFTLTGSFGIAGSATFVKNNAGTLTISNSNTYTGNTLLNGGLLNLNTTLAIGSGTLVVSGGTLGNSSGAAVVLASNNPQNWNADIVFSGPNDLNLGTGAVTLSTSRTVTVASGNLTVGGVIAGTGLSLTKAGGGGLILGGANTYNAGTLVTGGTLTATVDTALSSGPVSLNPASGTAVLALTSGSPTIGLLSTGGAGTSSIVLGNAAAPSATVLTLGASNSSITVSSVISDQSLVNPAAIGSLIKVGTATLTLNGANTYTGGTTLSNGTIVAGNAAALGTGTLTMNGGTLQTTIVGSGGIGSPALMNNIQINSVAGNVFNVPTGYNMVLGGNLVGSGTATAVGAYSLFLTGTNVGFGGTYINTANNTFLNGSNAGSAAALWVLSRGNLANELIGPQAISLGALSGNGGALGNNVASSAVTYTIGALNTNTTFGGQILDSVGGGGTTAITKTGSGMLTLTGAAGGFGYTGDTTVSAGTLAVGGSFGGDGAIQGNIVVNSGATYLALEGNIIKNTSMITVNTGGTFNWNGQGEAFGYLAGGGSIINNSGGGMYLDVGALSPTFSGSMSGALYIRGGNAGGGTQFLAPVNPITLTTLQVGTGGGGNSANLAISGGSITDSGDFQVGNGGAGTFAISGGSLTVSGTNFVLGNGGQNASYTQTGGVVTNNSSGFFGTANTGGVSTMTISGGTFNSTVMGLNLGVRGNSTLSIGGSALMSLPSIVYSHPSGTAGTSSISLGSGGTLNVGTISLAKGTGIFDFNGGVLQSRSTTTAFMSGLTTALVQAGGAVIDSQTYNVTIGQALLTDPSLGGASDGGLKKIGSGTLLLTGVNTYTGGTTIANGTLQLGNTAALGAGALAANGGSLNMAGYSVAVPSFSGANGIVTNSSAGTLATLTVNQSINTTFSGSFVDGAGPVGLNMNGSGVLTLANTNNYSGPTTVVNGVLYAGMTNALSSTSAVTVNGGTLDVSGYPQTIRSLTMNGGVLNLSATNLLSSNGAASFGGTLNVLNFTSGTADLMSYNSWSGTKFGTVTGLSPAWTLDYTPQELEIVSAGAPTWSSGSGSWNTSSNWNVASVPTNGAGSAVIVGTGTTTAVTISLDTPQTLGSLTFSNTLSNTVGYTLTPGLSNSGSLTMANTSSSTSSPSQIIVTSGSHSITAPVTIANGNLDITATGNSILAISGNIADDSNSGSILANERSLTLTSADGTGELILSGTNNYAGGTFVQSGTLILTNNEALAEGSSLTIGDASAFTSDGGATSAVAASSGLNEPLAAFPAITPVPEPGTLVLVVAGVVAGLATWRRRRNRAT